jgi:hypothetical protein
MTAPGGFPVFERTTMSDALVVTEFELNEQVFVPAGDGEPAKWMRKGALDPNAFKRNSEYQGQRYEEQGQRLNRKIALIDEAKRRMGLTDVPLEEVLFSEDEIAEIAALDMAMAAFTKEFDKHEAARDADIAAGRYWTIGGRH